MSDLDPSGLDLQRAWQEALERFRVDARFVRIALTREQVGANVDARGQPLEHLGIGVKPSDSRSTAYVAEHGERCWEVDILPAGVIEAELDEQVRGWFDAHLWHRREADIEKARALL